MGCMAVIVHAGKHQRCDPESELALISVLGHTQCLTHSHPQSRPWPHFAEAMSAARGIQSWGRRWLAQVYISSGVKDFPTLDWKGQQIGEGVQGQMT